MDGSISFLPCVLFVCLFARAWRWQGAGRVGMLFASSANSWNEILAVTPSLELVRIQQQSPAGSKQVPPTLLPSVLHLGTHSHVLTPEPPPCTASQLAQKTSSTNDDVFAADKNWLRPWQQLFMVVQDI